MQTTARVNVAKAFKPLFARGSTLIAERKRDDRLNYGIILGAERTKALFARRVMPAGNPRLDEPANFPDVDRMFLPLSLHGLTLLHVS